MSNLLAQAIDCDDPDQAAKIVQDALGTESDDVVNYCFPTTWPTDRERRAHFWGEPLLPTATPLPSYGISAAGSDVRWLDMDTLARNIGLTALCF